MELMSTVLDKIKATGEMPSDFESKEETNTLGPSNVSEQDLVDVKTSLLGTITGVTRFIIVDGIMLYYKGSPLLTRHQLDLALLLRSPYADLKKRRGARTGYVTLEGFWQDPPGYFDEIVWPGYVKSHSHLFVNGDVEGPLTDVASTVYGIQTPESMDKNMLDLLKWAASEIKKIE